jgi:ribosomal protein S18 acetylase RimI-like enzyme
MNAVASSDSFAVTEASLLDLFSIWRLQRACFPKDSYDLLTLFNMAVSPKMIRLKAIVNGQVIGFVGGERSGEDHSGWIVTLGVHPRYVGRGIGTALLLWAEKALNTRRVKLTVRRSNARAIALYERCGYKWTNTYRRYYHDGEDGLVMEKAF